MSTKKRPNILPLAAALAAFPGATVMVATEAKADVPTSGATDSQLSGKVLPEANMFVSTGKDLLSFTVGRGADGVMFADHRSHSSHSSHSSHHSSR
ncbi:His-Xaa-Ser repeat protein HxsA2 [Methylorubrum sp. B1-46]|uniref:His-Xaa-Ser repeat protein HxsA2 n=1 Tax=Methylorubrum sp. B1-46 TaxID=2897334 RepID=UPI0010424630|nr:His-Xaa-Ser repeat protein HxsA2 [Methylorubrum sp. B1-46]UGB26239.1 His-Xaa-Ser repeat protein HxsA2 [Methylorubrum sp. B1-46]